jgi:ElaB/YqjD/DUF883 family membrane-anchored ribosome-binding protein
MSDTTNNTGGAGGTTEGASARLSGIAQQAQQQFGQVATHARDWASQQGDVARQTVVERPFVSTGAAFAAGVVFGILLMRR